MEEPGIVVTVSFPALMISASCCPDFGYGPYYEISSVFLMELPFLRDRFHFEVRS
jgi:hypothetical protein